MITLYSGTPGSGKSLHCASKIWFRMRTMKKPVIANFPIDTEKVTTNIFKKPIRDSEKIASLFTYKNNQELTVKYLEDYAIQNHKLNREGQTLVIIDECALMFNSRQWDMKGRQEWISFFSNIGN